MRIVIATTAPDVGGVSRHVFDLAHGLLDRGHRVVVASRRDATPVIDAARHRQLPWISLERSIAARADVWHLHLHNTLDTRGLPLLLARRHLRAGIVVLTEHLPRVPRTDPLFPSDPDVLPPGKRRPGAAQLKPILKRSEYVAAHAVVAVSDHSRAFMRQRWGVDGGRLRTIYNGVSVPPGPPAPNDGDAVLVMGIATLHWLKGFDVLLEAAAIGQEPWAVRFVGDGVGRQALEARAAELAGTRAIEFTGPLPDASRATLEADVLCAPSRAESFSYVIIEAMACARPVVASAVDGAAEAVSHGETGLLVAPENPAALAAAIDRLAGDPELRTRMGAAGHARVRKHFDRDGMVEQTLGLYEELQWSHR